MEYRKITAQEFSALIAKYSTSTLIEKTKQFVQQNYAAAYKVIVKVNCDYNDNYYNFTPNLIVLDKEFNELDQNPKSRGSFSDVFDHLTEDGELREVVDDFSFFVDPQEIPELYVPV